MKLIREVATRQGVVPAASAPMQAPPVHPTPIAQAAGAFDVESAVTLDLSHSGDYAVLWLSAALGMLNQARTACLCDGAGLTICAGLAVCSSLTSLDLSHNSLTR